MTAPPEEVELKFVCSPLDLAAVWAAAPAGNDETRELISVYFDTADQALQKAGVSLRVRESQGRRVQTLKRGSGVRREEHETPIEGLTPDVGLKPLRRLLPDGESLRPAFNVRVSRRQRILRYQGADIEIALDQGEVSGGRARSDICEVELELKSGSATALYALAAELAAAAPLYLSFDGKASQGQALLTGRGPQPRHSDVVDVPRHASVAQAFQAVARGALGQIVANAAILRAAPQAEAVHQLRVGGRRLRSAMATFKAAVQDEAYAPLKAELSWLGKVTDKARNLDVFADEVVRPAQAAAASPAGLASLALVLEGARERARLEVSAAVSSDRFRRLTLELSRWIETGAWQADCPLAKAPARPFAAQALNKRHRKLVQRGGDLGRLDDAGRHEVRIEAKKLRYAVDGLAGLYRPKDVKAFGQSLKGLQTQLGALNDIAVSGPLLAHLQLPAEAAFAAGELIGRRGAKKARLIAQARQAYDRFAAAERFWR